MTAKALLLLCLPSLSFAARLTSVEISADRVRLATDSEPAYTQAAVDAPRRLVLDLPGAILPEGKASYPSSGPFIKAARASQYSLSPAIARVVLELADDAPEPAVEADATGLWVRFPVAPAPIVTAPVRRPQVKTVDDSVSLDFGAPEAAGLAAAFALLTLGVALKRRRRSAAGFSDDSAAIDDVQENINSIGQRLLVIERRLAQLESAPGREPGGARFESELRELRAVVRSIAAALELPDRPQ
jgi:hypothetical protein